ncbi:MAG: ester cyclase [Solirubrobacterales bacterium]
MATAETRSTEELARNYFAGARRRDVDAMIANWAPGGVAHIYGMAELRVPDGYREYFENLFAAFPDFQFEVVEVVASESSAAVRWRATGTFTGGARFQGLLANGARIETEGCDVLSFDEEGLVTENRAYVNGADIAQKLGALPPTGSIQERLMLGAVNLKTSIAARIRGR